MNTPQQVQAWLIVLALVLGGCGDDTTDAEPAAQATTATTISASTTQTSTQPVPSTTAAVTSTTRGHTPRYVTVRYRSDPVDIAHPAFEYLSTVGSSLVNGAWYDSTTGYTVINLNGTYYHYCNLPASVWRGFRAASSFGSYYNASIKGRYGCEGVAVPEY